ncbi:guanylate-binding protein 4 isoform X2 [Mustela putorius furo]|uniref:Guanylate-binding protein 4 isoform X2 n=1 Tax=Mustela putorius furo TaxID=9669 RepID=A0A8U0UMZ4_MUSPF|nr:guanylate-binding protein 4 isoform X2 [Mustela putorius furo]
MASGATMTAPICLVENQKEQLTVNPEALEILNNISQPVVVVAIAGLSRTGKSYLMNRLAGQNHGFRLNSTVRSETKGIWMWCVPHSTKKNHTLILLDTEGLGDVKKVDPKNDSWIFALTVLLSSTLIYNSMGTINHQALEQLHYVTELTQLIRAKSSSTSEEVKDSTEFVSFFPDFVWTVRDFTLELKIGEAPITEDEYLEDALKLVPEHGTNPKIQNSNMPRECIRQFFPKRKCFVFDRPTSDRNLLFHLEKVPEDKLDSTFQEQSKKFCTYIFNHTKTKTLREGITVTGSRLGTLLKAYVDAIKKGAVPCLENVVTTLAQRENSVAVQKAADHYSEQMAQRDTIEKKKEDFLQQNEDASFKYCQAIMKQLSEPLKKSISEKTFSVHGGHDLYLQAKRKVELDYKLVPRKGVKANEILQNFLQSQATIEESIVQLDTALNRGAMAIAVERAKKEAAEKEQEQLKQKEEEQRQKMEAQERSFSENLGQLEEKIKKERENFRVMLEGMLKHYLQVQEELLNERFGKKSEELNKEINRLKKEIETAKKTDSLLISNAIEVAGKVLIVALPEIFKLFHEGKTVLSEKN